MSQVGQGHHKGTHRCNWPAHGSPQTNSMAMGSAWDQPRPAAYV